MTAVIAVVAGFLYVRANTAQEKADSRFREATALRLVSEAQSMLAGSRAGGAVRAYQQLLAARGLATRDDGPLLSALVKMVNLIKVVDTDRPCPVSRLAPTAPARIWRLRQHGAAMGRGHRPTDRRAADRPHRRGVHCGVQPRRQTSSPPADFHGVVRLWDVASGQPVGPPLTGHTELGRTALRLAPTAPASPPADFDTA